MEMGVNPDNEPQTKRTNPKTLSHRVLHALNWSLGWKGLVLGNGKWWIPKNPGISFSASPDGREDPGAALEAKTWGLSISLTKLVALSPKSEEFAVNAVIHSMDEGTFGNLIFLFFASVGKTVFFCFIQTGSWEVPSASVHFKAAFDLSFFFRIRRISLNCEEWHGYYCQGHAAARLRPWNSGQDVVKNHHLQCSDR